MEEQTMTNEKLTDKAFLRLLIASISKILILMVCLCLTTYAWFTGSVPGIGVDANAIGECDLEICVYPVSGDGVGFEGLDSGVWLEDGEYLVELHLPAGSASSYCIIEAGGQAYFSDCLIGDSSSASQTVIFSLRLELPQVVTVTARCGIYTRSSDVVDGVITIKNN